MIKKIENLYIVPGTDDFIKIKEDFYNNRHNVHQK